jgi:type III restriction enzyme
MKIQFKHQAYQADAVEAVADCFAGQPKVEGVTYRLDPGKQLASASQGFPEFQLTGREARRIHLSTIPARPLHDAQIGGLLFLSVEQKGAGSLTWQ